MHSGGECMGLYPVRSVERAMKFQEVILRAVSKQITWMQAAEILGMSDRNMRRYRNRLEKGGYDGLIDRRTRRPSPKRVPMGATKPDRSLRTQVGWALEQLGIELIPANSPQARGRCERSYGTLQGR